MLIKEVYPQENTVLKIVNDDNQIGFFDVTPYLNFSVFFPLKNKNEFNKIHNGGHFLAWECGADLCVDTIEAKWKASI